MANAAGITTPFRDALPPLTTEELKALRVSIETTGVRNACLATEDGRLLDGHNRLDIDPNAPVTFIPGSADWTDEECLAFLYRCNRERRNLSPAQKQEVRRKMIETARMLREQDCKRFTEAELAKRFGVCVQSISNWLISNSSGGNAYNPDARVKIPCTEYETILSRVDAGESQGQVAADYGVTQPTISGIVSRARKAKEPQVGECEPSRGCTVADLQVLIDNGEVFSTIYADPPWQYSNQGTRGSTDNHYGTMPLKEIAALPVAQLAASNAHLHLWTTNAFLEDSFRIIREWGFKFKSAFVWVKPQIGMGNYWRVSHEYMLLGVRGSCPFRDRSLPSWEEIPRGRHSEKPERVRELIERVSPGPYLELFGRKKSPGWTVWGNQVSAQEGFVFYPGTGEATT